MRHGSNGRRGSLSIGLTTTVAAHGMGRSPSGVERFDMDVTCGQGEWEHTGLWGLRECVQVIYRVDV